MVLLRRHIFNRTEIDKFAELSGDYNAIHVNPTIAHREMFGRPIVHGMFVALLAMDAFFASQERITQGNTIRSLTVRFLKPVFQNEEVSFNCLTHTQDQLQLEVNSRIGRLMLIDLNLTASHDVFLTPHPSPKTVDRQSKLHSINDKIESGAIKLWLDVGLSKTLFPMLSCVLPGAVITELVALSRLVGMEYPGERSIFSQLTLSTNTNEYLEKEICRYRVKRRDQRFSMVDLEVRGPLFQSQVRAFFRPEPVCQPSFASICTRLESDVFAGSRALIVGGSRGLGEVTAKIMAAGGASVVLTYRNSQKDALRIVDEIGENASAIPFDVLQPELADECPLLTHLFYFATPHIFEPRQSPFDDRLFSMFKSYYVDGFLKTAALLPAATIFYPSSVAVNSYSPELLEYACAKFIGEQVCLELIHRQQRQIIIKRLPRIATDQTLSMTRHPAAAGVDVMLPLLLEMFQHDAES